MEADQIRSAKDQLEKDASATLQTLMDEFEKKTAWKIDSMSVAIADASTQLRTRRGNAIDLSRSLSVTVKLEQF